MSCRNRESCNNCSFGAASQLNQNESIADRPFPPLSDLFHQAETDNGGNSLHIISHIATLLSDACYASFVALITLHERLGTSSFIDLVKSFEKFNLRGLLIAWAWEYVEESHMELLRRLRNSDKDFVEAVNERAILYEAFHPEVQVARMALL